MGYFGKVKDRIKPLLFEKSEANQNTNNDRAFCDEEIRLGSKFLFFLLCLSSAVILSKYLSDGVNPATICKIALEMNYNIISLLYESFTKLFIYVWAFITQFQWILTPSLFAAGFVSFSWIVLYKDSDVPGVNPPTPFSPPRYRNLCTRSMDFSYALTGTFGLLIFIRLLYQSLRDSV